MSSARLARLRDRTEKGVAGDIRLLEVVAEERLGEGLGAANGLLDLDREKIGEQISMVNKGARHKAFATHPIAVNCG